MNLKQSESYFEEAVQFMPGGVNSPVRSYPGMGVVPPVLVRGEGPWVYDLDQNRYLDFVLSWGPLILGHTPNSVVKAIQEQAGLGTSFGAPTPGELELTRLIHEIFPCMEMSRLVSSGTEATMSALRLARGVTNRKKIIKFDGCYHGHGDSLLVQAGSGALTHGEPNSPGVLKELAEHTLIASFNDLKSVESLFHSFPEDIAA
ncbi:aminotransferase class III-fold pyridoxal phosphate-dependent enzyme, partial [bacterium]|nr:aminotransferase class III-fold pyridoxal phosphate-dependent enzyme [bacterium]